MKKILFSFCFLLYLNSYGTDEKTTVNANLKSATVYKSGAELTHTTNANLKQGMSELVIENIANQIDINSIQIKTASAVTLMGIEFSNNYLAPTEKSPRIKMLEDSIQKLQADRDKLYTATETNNELFQVLKSNRDLKGTQTGMSVTELAKLMDYYKTKMQELQEIKSSLSEKMRKIDEQKAKLQNQINEENSKNNSSAGRLILQLSVAIAGKYDFSISYIANNAYWAPFYDVRVDDIKSPIQLVAKAKIIQTTGIDWKQVKLSLSTSLPSQFGEAPILNSWYLSYYNPVYKMNQELSQKNSIQAYRAIEGKVAGVIKTEELMEAAPIATMADNTLNFSFDIALPYDVPTNGKAQTAIISSSEIETNYKHYAVPKLDKDAYLLAEITNWEKLNLMPGEANVIFEGTYVGKTFIDPNSTNDTLNLTLGRDKRVSIKREKLADFSSVKFLGSNKSQKFTYELTVRNNKKESINMILKDQFPLTSTKEIEVELNDDGGADVNAELGVLNWQLQLAAGEIKKIRFTYTIKFPKDKIVNLN